MLGQSLQWSTADLHPLHPLESPNDRLSYVVGFGWVRVDCFVRSRLCFVSAVLIHIHYDTRKRTYLATPWTACWVGSLRLKNPCSC
jgi:hypothetical protein